MKWDNPIFIYLTLLAPLAGLFLFIFEFHRKKIIENQIKSADLIMYSFRKVFIKRLLYILAIFFVLLSLAGPRWGKSWHNVKKQGREVMFVIDISNSMLANDVLPSRLELARSKSKFMVENIKELKAGIVFFAGMAFVHCPITFDMNAVRLFLNSAWDYMIPLGGTNIEESLQKAAGSMALEPGGVSDNYIILMTDGEELQGNVEKTVELLNEKNIKVICMGFGTEKGAPIAMDQRGQIGVYKKDAEGNVVVSRKNAILLEYIADQTGGVYLDASEDMQDVIDIVEIINNSQSSSKEEVLVAEMQPQYQGPLFLALLLLIIEFSISEKKRLKKR